MQIDLEPDQIDSIVTTDLHRLVDHFEKALLEENPNIFTLDVEYDRILLEEHIRATKLILKWYEGN